MNDNESADFLGALITALNERARRQGVDIPERAVRWVLEALGIGRLYYGPSDPDVASHFRYSTEPITEDDVALYRIRALEVGSPSPTEEQESNV